MIEEQLKQFLKQAVKKITKSKDLDITLEIPQDPSHGDFSTNIAMQLAKTLKENPLELAKKIVGEIKRNPPPAKEGVPEFLPLPRGRWHVVPEGVIAGRGRSIITDSHVAGPGFINFTIASEAWKEEFQSILANISTFGELAIGKGKTAITDTSHPNVAKPMMVHHVLSTIIGAAINNLLSNAGYKVIRDNYMGDWGTQYGKLTYAVKHWGNMEKIKKSPIPELLKLYVKFHHEAEKNPKLEDEGRKAFKALEDGEEENVKLWKWVREISMEEFHKMYKRLGVEFDMIHGESHYEPGMEAMVEEGIRKGIIVKGEEGALIIPMNDPNKPPCIIRKKDGASLYATRDLVRIKEWQDKYQGNLAINVVDVAQKLYFEQLFEAAEKMGLTESSEAPLKKMEQIHVIFGRMEFPEGRMSTRKGTVVLLEDILDEAETRALEKIKEHSSELPKKEQKELARIMSIGAVKYHILAQNRHKKYTFSWDTMLTFDGNSAPYLQYAYARTQSLLRNAKHERGTSPLPPAKEEGMGMEVSSSNRVSPLTPSEIQLIKNCTRFPQVLAAATIEYKPNILCTYLFELSQSFSSFYNTDSILQAENPGEKEFRLKLTETFAHILKKGLGILGIEVPERM